MKQKLISRLAALLVALSPFLILFGSTVPHRQAARHLRLIVKGLRNHEPRAWLHEADEACRLWPGNTYYHLIRALGYERSGRGQNIQDRGRSLEIASAELETAIHLNSADATLHQNLGWIEYAKGKPWNAARAFQQAISLDPTSPQAHLSLSLALRQLGRDDEAGVEMALAIQWSPSLVDSPMIRHIQSECPAIYEAAVSAAMHSLQVNLDQKTEPIGLARLSKLYLLRGEPSKAQLLAKHSLEAVPNLPRPWVVLGDAERLLGHEKEMRQDYVRAEAVSLDRMDASAYFSSGVENESAQHPGKAIALYQQALRRLHALSSEHAIYSQVIYGVSDVLANDIIPEELLAWTAPAPDLGALYSHLAACYRTTGKNVAAREYGELATEQTGTNIQLNGKPLAVCPISTQGE